MLLRTSLLLGMLLTVGAACGRPASPPPGPSRPASPPAPLPSTKVEAIAYLRTAELFEDAYVGYAGERSRGAAALRALLADPDAKTALHDLVAHGTPAGRLYGAAGLYFADPPAYDAALARIAADGGTVRTQRGCMQDTEEVALVIRSGAKERVAVPEGATLSATLSAHANKGGACDMAGGCLPLMLVDDQRPAPRGPVL